MTAAGAKAVLRTPAPPWFSKRSPKLLAHRSALGRQPTISRKVWFRGIRSRRLEEGTRAPLELARAVPDRHDLGREEARIHARPGAPLWRRDETGRSFAPRSFLRSLHHKGLNPLALAGCVPSIRRWKLAGLPTYLSAAQVQTVLDGCDRATALGRRDFAGPHAELRHGHVPLSPYLKPWIENHVRRPL